MLALRSALQEGHTPLLRIIDMNNALTALGRAEDEAHRAEAARKHAWDLYIAARDYADDTREAVAVLETRVLVEARRLADQGGRPNRDERRAQVLAGVGALPPMTDEDYDLEPEDDGLPY